jgi:CheY-like chemotaxis protein
MGSFDPSLHVLIAEDSQDDAFLLQTAFKNNGVMPPAHILPDGGEVIAYLTGIGIYADRILHPYPGIIILDLKMPRVNGFEVLEWLKQNPSYRVIPSIIWSASADPRDVKHSFCLGANGYLCKPNELGELTTMVEHLLAFWNDNLRPSVEPGVPDCETLYGTHPMMGSHHREA